MQASLTTDGEGRIVQVSSLRLGSSLSRWAIELLVGGDQLGLQLRWIRAAEARTQVECPVDKMPGERVSSLQA